MTTRSRCEHKTVKRRRCTRSANGGTFCWQHREPAPPAPPFAEFRFIRRDEIDDFVKLAKNTKSCPFFRNRVYKDPDVGNTLILIVQGRIYGYMMIARPERGAYATYFVEARCSLASASVYGTNKPPVQVGRLMWTAFVQLLRAAHPRSKIAVFNTSLPRAVKHHEQNCMRRPPKTSDWRWMRDHVHQRYAPDEYIGDIMVYATAGITRPTYPGEDKAEVNLDPTCRVIDVPNATVEPVIWAYDQWSPMVGLRPPSIWSCTKADYLAWSQMLE